MYLFFHTVHHHMAWTTVYAGLLLFGVTFYLSVFAKRDVTPLLRRTVYVFIGAMVMQALIGVWLLLVVGVQPAAEVHWIYGMGAALSLPFFVFIEVTAEKRPSLGSYIWGFGMLAAVAFRSILTG